MKKEWIPTAEQEAEGITSTDLMREYPPSEVRRFQDYLPVDGYGDLIPMNEWTVSNLAGFPDYYRNLLIAKAKKNNLPAMAKLLESMSPSEIESDTRWANHCLGEILQKMGLMDHRGPAVDEPDEDE